MRRGRTGYDTGRRSQRRACLGIFAVIIGRNYSQLPAGAHVVSQTLLGARDCVLILVKKLFDAQRNFHIALAINPLSSAVFLGRQHGKFRLPITQDMRLHSGEFAYFAYLEEEFLRYGYGGTTYHAYNHWRNVLPDEICRIENQRRLMASLPEPGKPPCYCQQFDVSTLTLSDGELKLILKGNA